MLHYCTQPILTPLLSVYTQITTTHSNMYNYSYICMGRLIDTSFNINIIFFSKKSKIKMKRNVLCFNRSFFRLKRDYTLDTRTRLFITMLDMLAFLPEELVSEGLRALKARNPSPQDQRLNKLIRYKERNYIGQRILRKINNVTIYLGRKTPR